MKHTWIRHILLLTALLHLFADVALAGGAVLCVGPDDHAAIEIGHLSPGCEILDEARTSGPDAALASDACAGCTDSPLHQEAEMASKRHAGDREVPTPLVAHALPVPSLETGDIERPAENRLDTSMAIRAHRSTVLLI